MAGFAAFVIVAIHQEKSWEALIEKMHCRVATFLNGAWPRQKVSGPL